MTYLVSSDIFRRLGAAMPRQVMRLRVGTSPPRAVPRLSEDEPHVGIAGVTLQKTRPKSIIEDTNRILVGRVLCKVTPTMPAWGLSSQARPTFNPHTPAVTGTSVLVAIKVSAPI